jgi:two-component system sensor histidine kinase KdpD
MAPDALNSMASTRPPSVTPEAQVPSRRVRTLLVWGRWIGLYVLVTAFFSRIIGAPELRISHGLLVYLLLIIGASRETRRWLSGVLVVLGYFAVDWFFVPPVRSFGRPADFDLLILVGFIITGVVITQLVSSLRTAVNLATTRAKEIEHMGVQQLELEREAMRARESRETEEMKNALIASISHDLRSPITTMKMLSDPGYGIDPKLALRRIGNEADRINQYLSTMRHFSAVGATGALMRVEAHVVDDLIGTALASYAAVLRGREVIVHPGVEGEILLVRCDLTLSLQVLGNLLQNAARHAPPPSAIELWAEREGGNIRIVVADRGPGVNHDEMELIFRPRQRGSKGEMHGGEGMGLAIARTFARAQLGEVQYHVRSGGGSEFSFTLPASAPFTE